MKGWNPCSEPSVRAGLADAVAVGRCVPPGSPSNPQRYQAPPAPTTTRRWCRRTRARQAMRMIKSSCSHSPVTKTCPSSAPGAVNRTSMAADPRRRELNQLPCSRLVFQVGCEPGPGMLIWSGRSSRRARGWCRPSPAATRGAEPRRNRRWSRSGHDDLSSRLPAIPGCGRLRRAARSRLAWGRW